MRPPKSQNEQSPSTSTQMTANPPSQGTQSTQPPLVAAAAAFVTNPRDMDTNARKTSLAQKPGSELRVRLSVWGLGVLAQHKKTSTLPKAQNVRNPSTRHKLNANPLGKTSLRSFCALGGRFCALPSHESNTTPPKAQEERKPLPKAHNERTPPLVAAAAAFVTSPRGDTHPSQGTQ